MKLEHTVTYSPVSLSKKRLNRYTHTISGLCAWWWEHATSSRSLRTGSYLTKSAPTVRQRFWGIRVWHIFPALMHHSVILIWTWLTIKVSVFYLVCVSRVLPASSTHRLFEGDHPWYTTLISRFKIKACLYPDLLFIQMEIWIGCIFMINILYFLWLICKVECFSSLMFWLFVWDKISWLCLDRWISSTITMSQTTGLRSADRPHNAVMTISFLMWRRQNRLFLTSREHTPCTLLWPLTMLLSIEWEVQPRWPLLDQQHSSVPLCFSQTEKSKTPTPHYVLFLPRHH